jgi:hypothetical protein
MQRDSQALISVASRILGWTLVLAIAGVFSIIVMPCAIVVLSGTGTSQGVLAGRSQARLVVVFVYKLRAFGFQSQDLYFLPILRLVGIAARGPSQIRADRPWR